MTDVADAGGPTRQRVWLASPTHDLAMAFVWVPFALVGHAVADDPAQLRWLLSATLLFSFAHQPLTLWLAYGDGGQRRAHGSFFAWAPLATAAAVGVGSSLRPDLVALVAGVVNVGHTIRQRYGISRLYGRLSSVDCGGDNRVLWSWLSVSVLLAVAGRDLGGAVRDAGLGERNTTALGLLASSRGLAVVLLPVAVTVAVTLTIGLVRNERGRPRSRGRLVYLGSTAVLLAVLAVDPVAGFIAYVGGHAAEYLLVARWRIDRAAERRTAGDRVGALARRIGSNGTMAVYAVLVAALIVGIEAAGGGNIAVTAVLTLGALHILYDGVIWTTPRGAGAPARD